MTEKKCNECLEVKPVSEFGIEARAKNGYKPRCKKCTNAYYNANYHKFKEAKRKQQNQFYKDNQDLIKARVKKYSQKNKESKKIYNQEYNIKNKEAINRYKLAYTNNKRRTDPTFRLKLIMRKILWTGLTEKRGGTFNLLGYNLAQLILTLGRTPELNESIDHKVPISWFDPETPPNIVHHLDNLQILTRSDNSRKNCFSADPIPKKYYQLIKPYINKNKLKNIPTWKPKQN